MRGYLNIAIPPFSTVSTLGELHTTLAILLKRSLHNLDTTTQFSARNLSNRHSVQIAEAPNKHRSGSVRANHLGYRSVGSRVC